MAELTAQEASNLSRVVGAIDQAAEAMLVVDSVGRIRWANETACRWSGYPKDVLMVKAAYELFVDGGARTWLDQWETLRRKPRGIFHTRLSTAKPPSLPIEVSYACVEVDGEPLAYLLVRKAGDSLVSRKENENEIETLRKHHELILNSAGEGIFGLDLRGHHTFVNPAAARMLGYEPGELLGRPSHQTWHHTKPDGNPYPPEECPIYRAYKDGMVHRGDNEWFWRKNGEGFPVEYQSTPIRDEAGTLVGAVVVFSDISERRRCEEAIARFRRHTDLILNAAGEGIFGLDLEGHHTFVNPAAARMLGYEPGELLGRPSHQTWHHTKPDGNPYPAEDCPIYRAYRDGMVHEGDDEVFWRKDGTSFPAQYTSTPIRDEVGRLIGAVVTFQDITEKKRLAAQLLEEAKVAEVSRVLGDVGHDIKNMLMPVLSGAQLLREELLDHFESLPPDIKQGVRGSQGRSQDLLDMIVNNAQRIKARVRELADAVKGVTTPPRFAPCQISAIVQEVLDTLRFDAESKQVTLKTDGLDNLPIIEADDRRLFNALYNLVNNAIPETPPGGTVTVHGTVEDSGHAVKVSVVDTGRGMPAEVRDSLLAGRARSSKRGGTGLGVKIVKDAVEAHGGTMSIDSESGVGTTFHLILPIRQGK